MKKIIFFIFFTILLFAKDYIINFNNDKLLEDKNIKLSLKVDNEGKPISYQKYDIRSFSIPKSLKIITAPGLKGTLKDEREIIAYYKTSINIAGLKIRNLYKVGIVRVYSNEDNLTISFDPDLYQNITSFLRYHNIKEDIIKDIDNLYGTWEEVE